MRFIYTFLFYLILPLILLRLLWRSRKLADYRHHWSQRFGFAPKLKESIWVHAVSVGESISAIPLIKELQKKYQHIVVTNMTPTGAARIKAAFADTITHSFVPYDLPDMVNRFLSRTNPTMVLIMETELWPNLCAACKKRHIPIFLLNARLSERSANAYQRISSITKRMFQAIKGVAAQSQMDAERFLKLGLPKEKITVSGNLKFDLEIPENVINEAAVFRKTLSHSFVWIAASTHPGEEEMILHVHKQILQQVSDALLILVPRHPNRFNEIAKLLEKEEFSFVRHSSKQQNSNPQVYLGDTMGELMLFYAIADVSFVAGSLTPIGGHNMLEPAVLGKPIITGPYLSNFLDVSSLLVNANGMIIIKSLDELVENILKFHSDEKLRQFVGRNAHQVIMANRGALQKQLNLITSMQAVKHFP